MENRLLMPGWNGDIDTKKLICYKIDLNREDIAVSTLVYYIKKGEYQSDIAFGIFVKETAFYLITNWDDILGKIIIVKTYVLEIIEKSYQNVSDQPEAIECFLHTLLDLSYNQYGFEKPVNTRNFLGKSAKGKLSDRRKIIEKFSITSLNLKREVNVYKSVSHSVFISNNKFIISFLPNYELFENLFDLPLKKEDRDQIEKKDKWNEIVFQTPSSFIERFHEYSNFIRDFIGRYPFINNIQINTKFGIQKLPYPSNLVISCLDKTINIDNNIRFEFQLLREFKENIHLIPSLKTELLIDNSIVSENQVTRLNVEEYIKKIRIFNKFQINQNISYFNDVAETKFDENQNYLVLINDNLPGFAYIYSTIKRNSIVSKVIKTSTLEKITDYEEHFLILWLSLYSRSITSILWFQPQVSVFDHIITIGIYLDPAFDIFRISGYILNMKKSNFLPIRKIFFRNDTNRGIEETIDEIMKSSLNRLKINLKKSLFILEEGMFTDFLLDLLRNITTCALIKRPNTRIFKTDSSEEGEVSLPKNGSFLQLFPDFGNKFMLITTGIPDEPLNGLPNPLLVEINSKMEGIKNEEILQSIFDLTFYQPESFSKVNLPFLISYKNRNFFQKIPNKYGTEVPF